MPAIRIFISYAHEDEIWLQQWLDGKQKQRNRRYFLDFWERSLRAENEECIFWWDGADDGGLRGGDRWQARILEEIDRADVVVLFITQDFVISPFIRGQELPRILARAKRGEIEVVPILLAPARWEKLEVHGLFQLTPGKPTPLSRYLDASEDEWQSARLEVAEALVAAAQRAKGNRGTSSATGQRTPVPPREDPQDSADHQYVRLPTRDAAPLSPSLMNLDQIPIAVQSRVQPAAAPRIAPDPAVTSPGCPWWASALGEDQYGNWADLKVDEATQRFRLIRPGTFKMGSPPDEPGRNQQQLETQHQVRLSKLYWMADSVCTQAMWQAVTGSNPTQCKGDPNLPVANVSWHDCQKFVNELKKTKTSLWVRLPTEAEWEYACRAGTVTPFSFGTTITKEQVNFTASEQEGLENRKAVVVKSMPANPWGLYEMHGNVEEWCLDKFGDYVKESRTDPDGPQQAGYNRCGEEMRAYRGGGFRNYSFGCRSASRGGEIPQAESDDRGLRLVIED